MAAAQNTATTEPGTSRLVTAYLAFAILLITLQSFYFREVGASVLCYAGALLIVPMGYPFAVTLRSAVIAGIFTLAIGYSTLAGFDYRKSNLGMVAGLATLLAADSISRSRRNELLLALEIVLAVHVVFFFVQVLWFFGTSSFLDYLAPLNMSSRVNSVKGLELFGMKIPRFSGLYQEPGTYSSGIMAMLAARYALSNRISLVSLGAIASVLATASLGGMVLLAVFAGAYIVENARKGRTLLYSIIIGVPGLIAIAYWAANNCNKRAQIFSNNDMIQDQMLAWARSADAFSLFGQPPDRIPEFYSLGYVGLWLDIYVYLGIITLIIVGCVIVSLKDPRLILCVGVLFLTKLKLTYPFFFICLALILAAYGMKAVTTPAPRLIRSPSGSAGRAQQFKVHRGLP